MYKLLTQLCYNNGFTWTDFKLHVKHIFSCDESVAHDRKISKGKTIFRLKVVNFIYFDFGVVYVSSKVFSTFN